MRTVVAVGHILLSGWKVSSASNNLIEGVLIQRHAVLFGINDENLSGRDSEREFTVAA